MMQMAGIRLWNSCTPARNPFRSFMWTLERLHAIAEGMELKLNTEMLKMEAER